MLYSESLQLSPKTRTAALISDESYKSGFEKSHKLKLKYLSTL